MRKTMLATLTVALTACNAIDVGQVDARRHPVSLVCIQENPKVKVEDFVVVLQSAFERHGIDSHVYQGSLPAACEYRLTYTARRSWDFAPYLAWAEIRLLRGSQLVGKVGYDHNNSLSLVKWEGTEAKIGPLLDDMLAQFTPDPGRPRVAAPRPGADAKPAPAAAPATASVAARTFGRYQYQADKVARIRQCDEPALAAQSPGIELYAAMCAGVPTSIRCEWGQCGVQE